jgi:hypothetical protein
MYVWYTETPCIVQGNNGICSPQLSYPASRDTTCVVLIEGHLPARAHSNSLREIK